MQVALERLLNGKPNSTSKEKAPRKAHVRLLLGGAALTTSQTAWGAEISVFLVLVCERDTNCSRVFTLRQVGAPTSCEHHHVRMSLLICTSTWILATFGWLFNARTASFEQNTVHRPAQRSRRFTGVRVRWGVGWLKSTRGRLR